MAQTPEKRLSKIAICISVVSLIVASYALTETYREDRPMKFGMGRMMQHDMGRRGPQPTSEACGPMMQRGTEKMAPKPQTK